jgi:hypothetical protein
MSDAAPLSVQLSDVQRYAVSDSDSDIPYDVYSFLADVAHAVDALTTSGVGECAGMSRSDALKTAREHVEALSTNGRGYQDGVKLEDKVRAVDRLARFLMGESE